MRDDSRILRRYAIPFESIHPTLPGKNPREATCAAHACAINSFNNGSARNLQSSTSQSRSSISRQKTSVSRSCTHKHLSISPQFVVQLAKATNDGIGPRLAKCSAWLRVYQTSEFGAKAANTICKRLVGKPPSAHMLSPIYHSVGDQWMSFCFS